MSESATPADEELSRWARDPFVWGQPQETLTGDAAAAYGRSLLEGAGVDIAAVEGRHEQVDRQLGRRCAGLPREGGRQDLDLLAIIDGALIAVEVKRRYRSSLAGHLTRAGNLRHLYLRRAV